MDIFDLLKKVEEKNNSLTEFFGDTDFLAEIIDDLWDVILKEYNIPEDNTVEMSEKYGSLSDALKDKKLFCRDMYYDYLYEFSNGKISKNSLIKKLKKK